MLRISEQNTKEKTRWLARNGMSKCTGWCVKVFKCTCQLHRHFKCWWRGLKCLLFGLLLPVKRQIARKGRLDSRENSGVWWHLAKSYPAPRSSILSRIWEPLCCCHTHCCLQKGSEVPSNWLEHGASGICYLFFCWFFCVNVSVLSVWHGFGREESRIWIKQQR